MWFVETNNTWLLIPIQNINLWWVNGENESFSADSFKIIF